MPEDNKKDNELSSSFIEVQPMFEEGELIVIADRTAEGEGYCSKEDIEMYYYRLEADKS